MKLKHLVAALAVAAAGVSSYAATATVLIPDEAWAYAGNADDFYSFTIGTSGSYTLDISATATTTNLIDKLDLYAGVGTGGTLLGAFIGPAKSLNWTFDITAPGTYSLFVDSSSNTALYSGSIAATTAVPEPESYALMLAGLGALGFMARRRQQG